MKFLKSPRFRLKENFKTLLINLVKKFVKLNATSFDLHNVLLKTLCDVSLRFAVFSLIFSFSEMLSKIFFVSILYENKQNL